MAQNTAPAAPPRSRAVVQLLAGCAVAAALVLNVAHHAPTHRAAGQSVAPITAPADATTPDEWNSGGS
jgi:hypothetical protein